MVLTNQDLLLKLSSIIAFLHNKGKQTPGWNFWWWNIPGLKRIRWKCTQCGEKSLKYTKHTALYLEHFFHRNDEKLSRCYFMPKNKVKRFTLVFFIDLNILPVCDFDWKKVFFFFIFKLSDIFTVYILNVVSVLNKIEILSGQKLLKGDIRSFWYK